jgi:hypothetical protein
MKVYVCTCVCVCTCEHVRTYAQTSTVCAVVLNGRDTTEGMKRCCTDVVVEGYEPVGR